MTFVEGVNMRYLAVSFLLWFVLAWSVESPLAQQPAESGAAYREEEVAVVNGGVTLAGTLTLPMGTGPFPVAVMITGSGPQDRDEDVAGFKVFKVLADHLARNGVGTYRFDDRGVGRSTGSFAAATTADFASDALAAVDLLRTRPGVNADRIGLIGHSDGAAAAAIAASHSGTVAFVVALAGPGARMADVLAHQIVDIPRAMGVDPVLIDRMATAHKKALDAARAGSSADLIAAVKELVGAQYDTVPSAQRLGLGERDAFVEKTYRLGLAQLNAPWMKFMLDFDPVATWKAVGVPVLALFGALDTQVAPSQNEAPVRDALSGNPGATIKVYPRANHLFQTAKTGAPNEYATLEKTFVPGFLDEITSWIQRPSRP